MRCFLRTRSGAGRSRPRSHVVIARAGLTAEAPIRVRRWSARHRRLMPVRMPGSQPDPQAARSRSPRSILWEERCLPFCVFGPVLLWALRRLDSICRSEVMQQCPATGFVSPSAARADVVTRLLLHGSPLQAFCCRRPGRLQKRGGGGPAKLRARLMGSRPAFAHRSDPHRCGAVCDGERGIVGP